MYIHTHIAFMKNIISKTYLPKIFASAIRIRYMYHDCILDTRFEKIIRLHRIVYIV